MVRSAFLSLLLFTAVTAIGQSASSIMHWKNLPALPNPVGFAGAYAGMSNGALVVAGRANFPENAGPWGTFPKTWYDNIYVLDHPDGTWKKAGRLPQTMVFLAVAWPGCLWPGFSLNPFIAKVF